MKPICLICFVFVVLLLFLVPSAPSFLLMDNFVMDGTMFDESGWSRIWEMWARSLAPTSLVREGEVARFLTKPTPATREK